MTPPAVLPRWPLAFALDRREDPTGISDTGLVASGMIWPDGRPTLRWMAAGPPAGYDRRVCQVATYESAADMMAVHGHAGATVLRTEDPLEVAQEWGVKLFALTHPSAGPPVWFWGVQWLPVDPAVTPGGLVSRGPAVTALQTEAGPCVSHWPSGVTADLRASWGRMGLELMWLPEHLTPLVQAVDRRAAPR